MMKISNIILSVVVVALAALTTIITAQGYRDYYQGVWGDGLATEWPTEFVYDPTTETLTFSAQAYAPNAKVWRWNPTTLEWYHLAFSGAMAGGKVIDNANGYNSNMGQTGNEGSYGVTLAINRDTGAISGYLFSLYLVQVVVMVQHAYPHGVSEVAGFWSATGADVPGPFGTNRLMQPFGMCTHMNSRRHFLTGSSANRMIELKWDAGQTTMDVHYLAGAGGGAGVSDGTTPNTATFSTPCRCVAYPQSEATPAALFFTEADVGIIRRIAPLPADPNAVFTGSGGSVVKTIFDNGMAEASLTIMLSIVEYPGLSTSEINFGHASATAAKRGIYRFKVDRSWAATTTALVPVVPIPAGFTADSIGGGSMPNGTVITLWGGGGPIWRGIRVWERGSLFAGTVTVSRTVTPCTTNPSVIDPAIRPPEGAIAPVTDSIFDFRTYQNLCCADVTSRLTWTDTCRTSLGTCTSGSAGVTLYSAFWLLHGKFDAQAQAEAWAADCLIKYLDCMRAGVKANPPPNHPTCGWGADAATKLEEPAECEIFVTAALTGMQSFGAVDKVPDICAGFFNNTAPGSAPPGAPMGGNDIISALPRCAAPNDCRRAYAGGGSCQCPADTTNAQAVSIYTMEFPLQSSSAAVTSKGADFDACRLEQGTVSVCSSKSSRSNEWVSMHVRDVLEARVNATLYRRAGNCQQPNTPHTASCTCPQNTSAFEYALPQDDGAGGQIMRIVTFCMPRGMATFFEGRPDLSSDAATKPYSKCVHPFGSNYSCECAKYATQRRIPVSIYQTRFTDYPTPGEWVFCDSDQNFPDEIDPAIVATTIGITIVGGVMGGSLSVLQAAAMMMTMCADNQSNASRGMVSFATIESAGEAGQFAFMAVLGVAVIGAHLLAAVLYFLLLLCCGNRPMPHFETGFIDTADLDEKPGVYELWEQAALKVRFPHWSCMFLRVVSPGFTLEAAFLFRNSSSDGGLYVLGAVGIGCAVAWVLSTLYFSWWGISTVAPDVCMQKQRPDIPAVEDEEGVDSSKKYADADGGDGADGGDNDKEKKRPAAAPSGGDETRSDACCGCGGEVLLTEFVDWDDGEYLSRPNINTHDADGLELTEKKALHSGGGGDSSNNDISPGRKLRNSHLVKIDEDGKTMEVRLPPYFTWYTGKATLSKFPACLNFVFVPRGWWTQRRVFNRRYATYYNTFMPRANKWCPTLIQAYMFFISVISIADECEVPMSIVGAVNTLMMLTVLITAPFRRPMETFFMTIQFAAASGLGYSRGQRWEHNSLFFVAVVFIALTTIVHHGIVQLFEMAFCYDDELKRFHDGDVVREKSLQLLKEHSSGGGGSSSKKYQDVTQSSRAEEEADAGQELGAAAIPAPEPKQVHVQPATPGE